MATRPALRHHAFAAGERPTIGTLDLASSMPGHPQAFIHPASSSPRVRPTRAARTG